MSNIKFLDYLRSTVLYDYYYCYIIDLLVLCFFFQCIFFFAYVWSIGATTDKDGRQKFDKLIRELMNGGMMEETRQRLALIELVPPPMEDYKRPFPIKKTVYDYKLVMKVSFIDLLE